MSSLTGSASASLPDRDHKHLNIAVVGGGVAGSAAAWMLQRRHALGAAMAKSSTLGIEQLDNIGPHDAPPLRPWREQYLAKSDDILALGYNERFIRTWNDDFSYCEAGFARRVINNLHLVLTRSGNRILDTETRAEDNTPAQSRREVAFT